MDNLEELSRASGGACGGTTVDKEFLNLFECIVGKKVMKFVQEEHTAGYIGLMRDFETIKRKTNSTPDHARWLTSDQLHLFTDASGTYGYGALFGSQWFLGKWDIKWQKQNIAFLELYPIVLAFEIWGHRFENQCIYFHTDNKALVSVINKQTSKDALIMFLIRRLVLHCLRNNVNFKAKHIYGSKHVLADALSRQQVQKFHRLTPWADTVPKPVPNLPDLPSYRNP
ncbi:unnamed protein product [Mytilus coruscus]|uniref:Reverse transcriptase RNase H-like domain-containing protein n=1 Tax=Mytilus coruscus TaxID=42192 RepID=A0A6J8CCI3_MYTCO|nr:unnamed protein product [Mytilus coruscus]